MKHFFVILFCMTAVPAPAATKAPAGGVYNIRDFGAKGDGVTLETKAIDKAIDAAAAAGGGTVFFPAGHYLSFTIHLQSNVSLYLDQGAVLIGAESKEGAGYDAPEPNTAYDAYQDFGHNHWKNSLICGEYVHDISILGQGMIWGRGLIRNASSKTPSGIGNKAIGLKWCRNVTIQDISILHGGHFAILATGVDNLSIRNLKIDTDRDGMDIDCCKNVRVSDCYVNSPFDDGICLKSSFGLGLARSTENVTVTNCQVSGYDMGTLLDGTFQRTYSKYSDGSPTGRIKMGTESNGGFKNVTISNCVFDYCRGLALETVDGALLEDVTISNITMRDVTNAPLFIRLGERMRGPDTIPVGVCRRIILSNIVVYNADPRHGCIISGVPGHPIEGLRMSDIHLYYRGGGTKDMAARVVPEYEKDYPEPYRFGSMPAYGFFIRHVKDLHLHDLEIRYATDDQRPPFYMEDVTGAELHHVQVQKADGAPCLVLRQVSDLSLERVQHVKDAVIASADRQDL
ncbi:rhamnogalacturonidase [Dinghuibacter silviterrae]|uniref:Pectate lyase-like protein n=1 Tax=Dinghuibacter silviterrae TaxID=1539049 RepID=A0A4V3GLX3_9BACT|nr:glycosyl hydrolase family 28-related protein [Dinghuibacter silviterrae]TDX01103.1 pectate lyase-like protein [Dinghuibacter silviterrae]